MTCTVELRDRAYSARDALRAPDVYVTVQSPREEPLSRWTLEIVVEDVDGPGGRPAVLATIAEHGLWLHDAGAQGIDHWRAIAVVA